MTLTHHHRGFTASLPLPFYPRPESPAQSRVSDLDVGPCVPSRDAVATELLSM